MNKSILSVFSIVLILNACKHPENVPTMSFTTDIQPIIATSCAVSGCHSNDAGSEFSLMNYDDIINNGDVRAGEPDDTDLYEVLVEDDPSERMPQSPRLPLKENEIKKIYLWIEQGAKNN